MVDILDSAGLHIDDLQTRIDAIVADIRANISPTFDANTESPQGQLIKIFAEHAQQLAELSQAVYASFSPSSATGASLDNISAITGTTRSPGTKSVVSATVNVDAGTYAIGALVASVSGAPSSRFANAAAVTNPGPWAANYTVSFEAEELGPTQALSGTLTIIAEPVVGWNSVTNASDALIGTNEETDAQLRARRFAELVTGSTNVAAIRTSLSQLTGMLWAFVGENDTDTTDGTGAPPHSISPVVYGPTVTDADIASTIFTAKPAGIATFGTDFDDVIDDQGTAHRMYFSRATEVEIYLEITVDVNLTTYIGDDELKIAVAEFCQESFGVGDDVSIAKIIHSIFQASDGINDVTEVLVGISDPPTQPTNYVIDWDEIALFDTARITINS